MPLGEECRHWFPSYSAQHPPSLGLHPIIRKVEVPASTPQDRPEHWDTVGHKRMPRRGWVNFSFCSRYYHR